MDELMVIPVEAIAFSLAQIFEAPYRDNNFQRTRWRSFPKRPTGNVATRGLR